MVKHDFDPATNTIRMYLPRPLIRPTQLVHIRVRDAKTGQILVSNWHFNYEPCRRRRNSRADPATPSAQPPAPAPAEQPAPAPTPAPAPPSTTSAPAPTALPKTD